MGARGGCVEVARVFERVASTFFEVETLSDKVAKVLLEVATLQACREDRAPRQ